MFKHMRIKHEEKPAETDNRRSHMSSSAITAVMILEREDWLLKTKMVTEDKLPLSFVEGEGFHVLWVVVRATITVNNYERGRSAVPI